MKKYFQCCLLLLSVSLSAQQIKTIDNRDGIMIDEMGDTINVTRQEIEVGDSLEIYIPKIQKYRFWTENNPIETPFDTALTIESFYNQNFTEKDVFGKMYFPNFGQSFNPLEYTEDKARIQLLPTGKSFNYLYPEEIKYYNVATPMTEFIFENGAREGQYLSTVFTHNPNKYYNYSIRYRGLRSLGRYENQVAANSAVIATLSHQSKNDRLKFWTHFSVQNINNEENGGIKDNDYFINDDEHNMTNRQNIPINLTETDSKYESRRFHLAASYNLFNLKKDSLQSSPLQIKNILTYEKQKYSYKENKAEDYFPSEVFLGADRKNLKSFESFKNTTTLGINLSEKLLLEAGIRYENAKLYSDSALVRSLVSIPKKLDDNLFGVVGKLYFDWNERIKLNAEGEYMSGSFFKNQYNLNAVLDIQPINDYHLLGGVLIQSSYPSLNLVYNQSFYQDYNYYNKSFDNVNTQKVFGEIRLDKFKTSARASFYNVENYVYVADDYHPKQLDGSVKLFKIKLDNSLTFFKKFNLRTTLQYQKITQNEKFLPLPDFIGRASLYWQSPMFNDAAIVQIGFNVNYFTKFESREFFPVINEFMFQPEAEKQEIGNYPIFDFFLNIKVKTMRIYLRADHFNTLFGENNYFSAPKTPFRDFKFQVGIKWYLFT